MGLDPQFTHQPIRYYILDGKTPVPCDDLLKWTEWFHEADRHVAKTELPGDVLVSTVFLGVDHNFLDHDGKHPILFETMVFGGEHDGDLRRYETWEAAEQGHQEKVAKLS